MLPDNQAHKNMLENFYFFAHFKSYDYFSEENACFMNSQSLTQVENKPDKQSKQNQNFPTPFLRKRWQEDIAMLSITSSHSNLTRNEINVVSEPLYFGK